MDEENKDLKTGEGEHQEEESASEETTDKVKEDLENSSEDIDKAVDEMLADGTPKDKTFTIKKEKYDELSEKSKLYDSFSPLLSRLNKKPELVDKLLENQEGESIEQRLDRLENERRTQKATETRAVLQEATRVWPDLPKQWTAMRPLVEGLEKQGIPYKNAVQQAYFAVNPDAVKQEEKLIAFRQATEIQNSQGMFSSSSGSAKIVHNEVGKYDIPQEDIEFGKRIGVSAEMYQKHWKYIQQKGFDNL